MYTDRAVFKGSPAQFYAVIEEYELDSKLSGMFFFVDLVSPTREIVLSHTSAHPIFNNYKHDYVNKVPDLNHLSPRCVVSITTESKSFDITAVITADQKTRITALARDEQYFEGIKHIWKGFLGYAENFGWVEKETLVQVEDEREGYLGDNRKTIKMSERCALSKPIIKPEKGMGKKHQDRWVAWFNYYHEMNRRGYNYTIEGGLFNDLEKAFNPDYLKQLHLEHCQDEECSSKRS